MTELMTPDGRSRERRRTRLYLIVSSVAHEAYEYGRQTGLRDLMTVDQVAELLEWSDEWVLKMAHQHGVGHCIGSDVYFLPEDVTILCERLPGVWASERTEGNRAPYTDSE